MKKFIFLFVVIFTLAAFLGVKYFWKIPKDVPLGISDKIWKIQSIDTVKYSRDLAREKLQDSSFDTEIQKQVSDIAATGATHIAIATPYDDEFIPYLRRWVSTARKNKLHVWFRGNLSGWEGWFGYSSIDREQHTSAIISFIQNHPDLFADGDIFTSCPECENGGPGDPRLNGDVDGFRQFLISENNAAITAFKGIHKKVSSGFYSMNGDVAKLIMNEDTTKALGGLVTIDHYVQTPDQLISFVDALAEASKGKIVLGEWGAPIPDINGDMTEDMQAAWVQEVLDKVSVDKNVLGINYWTNRGGSTALWNDTGKPNKAVAAITGFYSPRELSGTVENEIGDAIYGAAVKTKHSTAITDYAGRFRIQILPDDSVMNVDGVGYIPQNVSINDNSIYPISLVKQYENGIFRIAKWLHKSFSN